MSERDVQAMPAWRYRVALALVLLAAGGLIVRAVDLQVLSKDFLQDQGQQRHVRVLEEPAHRGILYDRNGEPLAISTPVESVWAHPGDLLAEPQHIPRLARQLEMDPARLRTLLKERAGREFVYLKRHVAPEFAQQVMAQKVPGIGLQREYRRFYPAGEVTAHVLGFNSIDDTGQEGLELAFDDWLRGKPGQSRVIKDRLGRVVETVESIRAPRPGRDLTVSIDRRLQYLAYRELKAAVIEHRALSGSAVMLDVRTGEVLAMVSQPSFNPNDRGQLQVDRYRNRAVTDVFEPGSTIKPFTIAAALDSGRFRADTVLDTAPGSMRVANATVRDVHNLGAIDVTTVLTKSSNVGAAKLALALPAQALWDSFSKIGFGVSTQSGFPGEQPGSLGRPQRWGEVERATLSFGYGLSVTPLQLAQAYAVLARDGLSLPVSLVRLNDAPEPERAMNRATAIQVRGMLEGVVAPGGTATTARVQGYRVAGKTGTARKSQAGGYAEDRYIAVFAGMAPASRPRIVMVVMIDEPRGAQYYGGQVAAPVFARVMAGALRLLDIAPDDMPEPTQTRARGDGGHA